MPKCSRSALTACSGTVSAILSAAFAVVRLTIGDAVVKWRTDSHLTASGMELAYHACGLVLARFAACRFDASPLGCNGLRKPNAFTEPVGAVQPAMGFGFGLDGLVAAVVVHWPHLPSSYLHGE